MGAGIWFIIHGGRKSHHWFFVADHMGGLWRIAKKNEGGGRGIAKTLRFTMGPLGFARSLQIDPGPHLDMIYVGYWNDGCGLILCMMTSHSPTSA